MAQNNTQNTQQSTAHSTDKKLPVAGETFLVDASVAFVIPAGIIGNVGRVIRSNSDVFTTYCVDFQGVLTVNHRFSTLKHSTIGFR